MTAFVVVASLVVALAVLPGVAAAASSDSAGMVVGPDETVTDDLTVATGSVVVKGTVEGDVTALSGSVTVSGTVEGDVSAASGSVTVAGTVGGDVSAAAGSVDLEPGATVGGDVSAGAGSVEVAADASVGERVAAGAGTVTVDGDVGGDVEAGRDVVLGETAAVDGDVRYHGSIQKADGATVGGVVSHESGRSGIASLIEVDAGGIEWADGALVPDAVPGPGERIYWIAVTLLVGAVLLVLAPDFSAEVVGQATGDPVRSGAAGVVALVGVPVVLVVFALTIVGIPVTLAGTLLFALGVWVALIYGEYVVGRRALSALEGSNRWLALAVGVVGVEALGVVPVLGSLVKGLALLLGIGACVLVLVDRWRGDGDDAGEPTPARPVGTA